MLKLQFCTFPLCLMCKVDDALLEQQVILVTFKEAKNITWLGLQAGL